MLWTSLLLMMMGSIAPVSAADSVRIPNFWDLRRKIDKPDLGALRQIRFLTEDDYPPFHFIGPDGQLTGFEVELARAVCEQLKVTCSIQPIRWDGLGDALLRGQGDAVIAAMKISAENRRKFMFTASYFRSPARFVARKNPDRPDLTSDALKGQKISVVIGSAHEAYLKRFFGNVVAVPVSTATDALDAVRTGSVTAAFVDGTTGAFWINGEASAECCSFWGGPYTEQRYFGEGAGIALRPDSPVLRQALDWALARIAADGHYAALYLKYFPVSIY